MPSSSISSVVAFETFLLAKVFFVVPINTFANKKVSNATAEDIEDEGIHKLIDIFDHLQHIPIPGSSKIYYGNQFATHYSF
jgi:hypothetical protein